MRIAPLEELREMMEGSEADDKMAAHNRLYEAQLQQVQAVREQIKVKTTGGDNPEELRLLQLKLKGLLNKSLMFANEAYLTDGAVTQVVGVEQIKANLILTLEQYTQAFNENIGDSFKELDRHAKDGVGFAAVKAGKYMYRAMEEIKMFSLGLQRANISEDITAMLKELERDRKGLSEMGAMLQEIKNASSAAEADGVAQAQLASTYSQYTGSPVNLDLLKRNLLGFSQFVGLVYNTYKSAQYQAQPKVE